MVSDPAALATTAFAFRIGERVLISLVIVAVSLVVTRGFWKSIQKVDFSVAQGSVSGGGSLVLATPVFALLALIGFAWVSFSHPVSVTLPVAAAGTQEAGLQGVTLIGASPAGGTAVRLEAVEIPAEAALPADPAFARTQATQRIQSLNCIASLAGGALSARDADALDAVKVDLMRPVWTADWGDAAAFGAWATGRSTDAPNPAARAVFDAVHPLC